MVRRLAAWLAFVLGGLLVLVALLFGLAQTGPGRALIERQIAAALSPADGPPAEVAGLRGVLPFDVRLARLGLTDREGIWLRLEDVRFDWSVRALLRGHLLIEEISARSLEVLRPPVQDEEIDGEPAEPIRLPELPEEVPPVTVQQVAVDQIVLHEPVLGERAIFTLAGRILAPEDRHSLLLDLALERTDERTARAQLDARLDLDPPQLDLNLLAQESGGLLAAATGRPDAGDLSLSLAGAGPLESWTGRLNVDAQGIALAEATIRLAALEQLGFGLVGEVRPSSDLFPAEVAPLIGERIDVVVEAVQTAPQALRLDRLRILTSLATLDASGRADFEQDELEAAVSLNVQDLAPLSSLAGMNLQGSLDMSVGAGGAPVQPRGRIHLEVEHLAIDEALADRLRTTFEVAFPRPVTEGEPSFELQGEGSATGLALANGPELPERDLTWRLDIAAPAEGAIVIRELRLAGQQVVLAANGAIDRASLAGQLQASLEAAALGPLSETFGQRIEGALALISDVTIAEQARSITIELSGELSGLEGLPPGAGEFLGREVMLSASGELEPGRRVTVSQLLIDAAASRLGGWLDLDLATQDLAGALNLNVPDLSVIEPMVEEGIAGSLVVDATLGGTPAAPSVALEATGEQLAFGDQALARATLTATAAGLPETPEGDLRLVVGQAGLEAALSGRYRLADQVLRLADLALRAPQTTLDGAVAIALDPLLIEGGLSGRMLDLAALEPLTGIPLRGRLDLQTELSHENQRQSVTADLQGTGLEAPFGQVERVQAQASVQDALATPRIEAAVTFADLRQEEIRIGRGDIAASGTPSDWTIAASADGEAFAPFTLETDAEVTLGDAVRVRLSRLEGRFAEQAIRLASPASVVIAGSVLTLEGLDLHYAGAQLAGDARLGEGQVEADATLRGLPLELLARFGAPDFSGRADATLRLSGPSSNPQGTLDLTVSDLRPADPDLADLPPARIAAQARLLEQRLHTEVRVEGWTDQPLMATLAASVVLALDPFAFELPENDALSGRVDGEMQLSRIDDLIDLGDQQLDGLLRVALSIGGTIAEPGVEGSITVTDGGYENGTTGTVLRQITLNAEIREEALVISEFSATDGGRGRLNADGRIAIEPDATFPFEVRARVNEATLVRRDDIEAAASAQLEITGNLERAVLAGRVTVERVEASIPDSTGPSVATIDVIEVRRGADGAPERTQETPDTAGFELRLNLTVDIPGRVFVRGRGLESEWGGQLRIVGTADSPRIEGTLEIRRGHFDFIDRRFELRQGVIEFTGDTPPVPEINLEAVAEGGGITAIVRLSGPATEPELAIDSEPSLPQDEVLSRLLFNRQVSEISAAQAVQLGAAVNRLRGGQGFDLLGGVRDALGVDVLDVGGGDEPGEATVRAGRYLGDDVYVEVEQGIVQRSGRARVEIEILPDVAIEAETRQDASTGIGIKWKYDY